jgi:hypothetical protein
MTNFRFFFFDALGIAKASTTGVQASESDAIAEAERRLIERAFESVEVWRGTKLIHALKRGGENWIPQPLGVPLSLHPLFA